MNSWDTYRAAPVHTIDLGSRVAYRRFGHGPPIVFVHGWPLCGATYRGLVAELSREFTCYVPDLPGAGDSPWNPNISNIFEAGGELIVRFADALGLERLALIAHDSGGTMARFAAAALGQRVSALALTNTELPDHFPPLVHVYQVLAQLPGAASLFGALLSFGPYRRSALGLGGCFGDRRLIDGDYHAACVAPLLNDMQRSLQVLRAADFRSMNALPALHRSIQAPVVLVWGSRDPFFPVARARRMLEQFADARGFHEVDFARLLVHEEAPEQVARFILPLLRQTSEARKPNTVAASA